ncbi:phage integrase SAM-like domain-containing protein [Dyadobacter sp. CY327]|nr:phage integrase SAM-like domain-containing protein [Dyadobacter sp. CY327]
MKGKRNISHNMTMKYLAYFKKIVLLCVKNGWIIRDPFLHLAWQNRRWIGGHWLP